MKKFVQVTRSDEDGSYVERIKDIDNCINAEFSDARPGTKLTLELLDMTEDEYDKLPEFMGW